MTRQTRNRLCIWVIALGLLNILVYTVAYARLGGDAGNGYIGREDGQRAYYLAGGFIRGSKGDYVPVSRSVWIYSYIHSITMWPTQAAMLLCLLVLARPHILATMREGSIMRGPLFVTLCGVVILLIWGTLTVGFTIAFVGELLRYG